MSFVQLVSAFRLYGADVLLLALGVTLLTSLLKKTVMKTVNKKVFVFLPFALGFAVYAAYRILVTFSLTPITDDLLLTLESGFGCGCAATLYYIVYEQFLRGKFTANPLLPLLDFVPEAKREEAANALLSGTKGKSEEEKAAFIREHLNAYLEAPMSEEELLVTAKTLAKYLTSLESK